MSSGWWALLAAAQLAVAGVALARPRRCRRATILIVAAALAMACRSLAVVGVGAVGPSAEKQVAAAALALDALLLPALLVVAVDLAVRAGALRRPERLQRSAIAVAVVLGAATVLSQAGGELVVGPTRDAGPRPERDVLLDPRVAVLVVGVAVAVACWPLARRASIWLPLALAVAVVVVAAVGSGVSPGPDVARLLVLSALFVADASTAELPWALRTA